MTYKIYDGTDHSKSIEFIERDNGLTILSQKKIFELHSPAHDKQIEVHLTKEDLFELIGGLLRIQSKLKQNG